MENPSSSSQVQPLRKLIHLGGAIFALLYLIGPRSFVLLSAVVTLVLVWGVEWARQRFSSIARIFEKFIGPALRQGEARQPTAGLWSMVGILITLLIFERALAIPAILYAHLGDPAAEVVGRRWGRHRLPNGKSLEGSLGCLVVGLISGLICCQVLPLSPGVAVFGALSATIAEAVPLWLGDNLLMAPFAGLAMALVTRLTG